MEEYGPLRSAVRHRIGPLYTDACSSRACAEVGAHADLVDCHDILLIDEPKTYKLIDEMFRTMASNLSSRNINIGMDEAHMMGLGKYLDKHGYHDRSALMMKHFSKVMDIARSYGYKPMMWSDMFFRLASGGEYYDPESQIREDIASQIPEDLRLVYWDYYTEDRAKYDGMMRKHKQLSDNIVFAGGLGSGWDSPRTTRSAAILG